jgi:hypothetical protein
LDSKIPELAPHAEEELFMRLSSVYEEWYKKTLQQGLQQGQRVLVENLLSARFGKLDDALSHVVNPLLQLPPEESSRLLIQNSREDLLARFSH